MLGGPGGDVGDVEWAVIRASELDPGGPVSPLDARPRAGFRFH